MQREYTDRATQGRFIMHINDDMFRGHGLRSNSSEPINTFVLSKDREQEVFIDEMKYIMPAHSILPLVFTQHFRFQHPEDLVAWQFNRDFYCILDNDREVGCVGFLFYGIHHPMFIQLTSEEIKAMENVERVFSEEIKVEDNFEGEMLRSLLRRLIIKITRIAKKQSNAYRKFSDEKMDLIRNFSILLECNFKTEHEVKFYAAALNKSPKTLCNFFASCHESSPLRLIHARITLEAKRYLHYTDKTAREIAYELGFENPEHFSRFFKTNTGKCISEFKKADKHLLLKTGGNQ